MKKQFTDILMEWHRLKNKREMPWKGEKDPYKIWLSEIILQQTRVEQGWSYYNRFIEKYPKIQDLAAAEDRSVFKLWEGLGYYNRCKNLLFTARQIVTERKAHFPETYEEILSLKGIGPYTAAAIASFGFNLPYAVVDGNVFRVLSRFFGVSEPIDSTKGKKIFSELANAVLDRKRPGSYNQAIMDFGATVCKPASPLCFSCPLQKFCKAFNEGIVNQLPIKEKVLQKKVRRFTYFIFEHDQKILVQHRLAKDIWQNLFEFYLLEMEKQEKWNKRSVKVWLKDIIGEVKCSGIHISSEYKQQLTHQLIKAQFIQIKLDTKPNFLKNQHWVSKAQFKKLAFPKIIHQFLEENEPFLPICEN
jgi:A/G-specific adenine glycosylase